MKELDTVVLTKPISKRGLKAGDVGTIVLVHPQHKGYEVEFVTLGGDTLAVLSLTEEQIRPVGPDEIAQARAVKAGA